MSELIIGTIAGILTTFSALPQLYYSYKNKDVRSFTLKFLFPFIFGIFCWVIYGFLTNSLPIIVFNIIALCLWLPIVILKINDSL